MTAHLQSHKKVSRLLHVFILCFCIICFSSCESRQKHTGIAYSHVNLRLRTAAEQKPMHEGEFEVEMDNLPLIRPCKFHPLTYPATTVHINLKNIPAGKYVLYCPSTGCPKQPEFKHEITVKENGSYGYEIKLFSDYPPILSRLSVMIYAMPTYASDWYLVSVKDRTIWHTTYNYKPLVVTGKKGQSLELVKKECGGNVMEAVLRGFEPYEVVTLSTCSEGEETKSIQTCNQDGFSRILVMPQVAGLKKGTVTAYVITKDEKLELTAYWDTATLNIPRKQPLTGFHKVISSLLLESENPKKKK